MLIAGSLPFIVKKLLLPKRPHIESWPICLLICACCLLVEPGIGQSFKQFSQRDGAPVGLVQGIAQDARGFMWFASTAGLFRYDSRSFKAYRPQPNHQDAIVSRYVHNVFCDSKGKLWAATAGGLSRYEAETDSFTNFKHDPADSNSLSGNNIFCIVEDEANGFWVGSASGLDHLTFKDGEPQVARTPSGDFKGRARMVRCIAKGSDGVLWLGTYDGLVKVEKGGKSKKIFKVKSEGRYPSINEFIAIYADQKGSIWLGSNRGGLIRFDIHSESFHTIESFRRRGEGLPIVSAITADHRGKMWIGTWSGMAYFDTKDHTSDWLYNIPENPNSLPDNLIYAVCKDNQGGVWVGSYDCGVSYLQKASVSLSATSLRAGWLGALSDGAIWAIPDDRSAVTFFNKKTGHSNSVKLRLPFAVTYNAFWVDEHGILWCGGSSVLSRYDIRTHQRSDYPVREFHSGDSTMGLVTSICQDRRGRLWVAGVFGLALFDKEKLRFEPGLGGLDPGSEQVSGRYINYAVRDSKDNLWFGGVGEVFLLKSNSKTFERISFRDESSESAMVLRITEDQAGRMWFATQASGLHVYDYKAKKIVPVARPVETALDVQADNSGFLWIVSASKLVRYHPDRHTVQYYDAYDGLPSQAILRAATSTRDLEGNLYFGTSKQVFCVDPRSVVLNRLPSRIVITGVKLFNRVVTPANGAGILSRGQEPFKSLVFNHKQNFFSLDFALLSFFRSDRNRYAYMLEGFDEQWNYVDYPSATYTSLPAGKYTFLVKAVNGDGIWVNEPLRVSVTILPPWWRTWYACLAYVLLAASAVYAVTRVFWMRALFKKEDELYQAKLDFFTNVSHEIRTHLTLVSGPLDKALRSLRTDSTIKGFLDTAKSNADRLMGLVEELLDFRKLQNGDVRLRFAEHDLVRKLTSVTSSFEHAAAEKQIDLQFDFNQKPVKVWIDASQMQKVFYNLLGNAIKYTPKGGRIAVAIVDDTDEIRVTVTDNGRGISPEHLPNLFTNFYQVYNGEQSQTGYGIGLALSKGIVDRHGGELGVTSRKTDGISDGETVFTITLLKGTRHISENDLVPASIGDANALLSDGVVEVDQIPEPPVNPVVLLIEDNDELRAFERETLREKYRILEADDGQDGLRIARETLPDLIVCDVMLPGLSGLEVCRKLKSDILTSHIPIIQLSARTEVNQILEGLRAGADDYLVKPFNLNVFEAKIHNLIQAKQILKHWYSQSVLMEPDHVFVRNMDGEFVIRLKNLVLENISDPGFGVKEMSRQMGTSVAVLYRKLRDLTGMTVNDFMKRIRMARAMQLLESGEYHVSEVAVIVGYESSKYFGKEFKKFYGKTPVEVRRQPPL